MAFVTLVALMTFFWLGVAASVHSWHARAQMELRIYALEAEVRVIHQIWSEDRARFNANVADLERTSADRWPLRAMRQWCREAERANKNFTCPYPDDFTAPGGDPSDSETPRS